MRASLHLTHDCNLRCDYCYTGQKTKTSMSPEIGRDAVDFVLDLSTSSAEFIFFGGEPLLEFDLMRDLIAHTRACGSSRGLQVRFTLITNGTILARDILTYLQSEQVSLRVSLDGNQYAQDCSRRFAGGRPSYPVLERRFSDILEFYPDVMLLMVITPTNVIHLHASITELHRIGFRHFVASPAFETGWSDRDLALLAREYSRVGEFYMDLFRRGKAISVSFIDGKISTHILSELACGHQCEMARGEVAIAASGRIYPCLRLVGEDVGGQECIGTIYAGIDEKRRSMFSFRPGEVMKGCERCALARRCINSCGALNYAMTGDIRGPSGVVCAHERMAIPLADRVGNALYRESNPVFLQQFYCRKAV